MHPPIILQNQNLPRLYCKPQIPEHFIHYSGKPHIQKLVCFRSLNLEKELPIIHQWVNMPYTSNFWQMEGPYEPFSEVYKTILQHPNAHSFTGYYGDQLICQLDIYMVGVDELSFILTDQIEHCGFHLLMAPNQERIPGLTNAVIKAFLEYYFSFPETQKMFAEPDTRNQRSIALLKQAGFQFVNTINLSYKCAHLYELTREQFFSNPSPSKKGGYKHKSKQ